MSKFNQGNAKEITLKDYFDLIKKRYWIVVMITVIATLAGYFYSTNNNVPLYQTSTRMIIGPDGGNMKTLMVMIKDPIIMEMVRSDQELSKSAEGIASQVEVTRIDESQVIMISVIDQNPEIAAAIANATAKIFKDQVGSILEFEDVQLLSEAKVNGFPINESTNRIVIIAFVFGLITGVGLIFVLDSLDSTVRKEQEVEELLGIPVLGIVSNMNKKKYTIKKIKKKDVQLRGETVDVK